MSKGESIFKKGCEGRCHARKEVVEGDWRIRQRVEKQNCEGSKCEREVFFL